MKQAGIRADGVVTGVTDMAADKPGRITEEQRRKARLAEQLRKNLQRRKAQARARRSGAADSRPGGLDPASTGDQHGVEDAEG